VQDQHVSFPLELESSKAHHHRGVGFDIDEKDITNHRRAQASPDPGVALIDGVGIAPGLVQSCAGYLADPGCLFCPLTAFGSDYETRENKQPAQPFLMPKIR
jgi:hypothetical protein